MGSALYFVVLSDATRRVLLALAENTLLSAPDLTCKEQWPTQAESRHAQLSQEQRTTLMLA